MVFIVSIHRWTLGVLVIGLGQFQGVCNDFCDSSSWQPVDTRQGQHPFKLGEGRLRCHGHATCAMAAARPFKKRLKMKISKLVGAVKHVLVGGLEHFLFFHTLGIIIPTD